MGYMERHACKARRGRDGVVQVEGGGFVSAAFRYRMSWAEDPLLHTHVVVGNLTQGPDGRWTALDARHLYRHAKAAGYLYQAALREELTERLGVQWTLVESGTAEVAGVDRASSTTSRAAAGRSWRASSSAACRRPRPRRWPRWTRGRTRRQTRGRWGGCERSGAPAPPSSASTRTSWPACSTWSSARCVTSQSMWSG